MKPADKDKMMRRFRDGKIQLLVATTVVEVGIDVPQATVMIVQHAERLGRFLIGAGRHEEGLQPLLVGARGRQRRGEFRKAQQLLSHYLRALKAMGAPDDDPRWGTAWVLRAQFYMMEAHNAAEAKTWAARAVEAARKHDWDGVLAGALAWWAIARHWLGDADTQADVDAALRAIEHADRPHDVGVGGSLAHLLISIRRFDDARHFLDAELDAATAANDQFRVAQNHYYRCRMALFQKDWDEAMTQGKLAYDLLEAIGNYPAMAWCNEYLAEVRRLQKNWDEAEKLYRKCIAVQEATGMSTAVAQTNLANILLQRGKHAEAERLFYLASEQFRVSGRRRYQIVGIAGMLAAACHEHRTGAVDEHLPVIAEFVDETSESELDLATLLEDAAVALDEAGAWRDAARVYREALRQWELLEDEARVAELRESIERLS